MTAAEPIPAVRNLPRRPENFTLKNVIPAITRNNKYREKMMARITMCVAALVVGLIGLLAFLDNANNLQSGFAAVQYVVSEAEQPVYKNFGPAVRSPVLIWAIFFFIMAVELAVGVLGFWGLAKMIQSRTAEANDFQSAKSKAVLGASLGMLLWYGAFVVIGELYFNFWQTAPGLGSAEGAFRYGTVCAVLYFFLSVRSD
jgi:predicted small integral membrane protein